MEQVKDVEVLLDLPRFILVAAIKFYNYFPLFKEKKIQHDIFPRNLSPVSESGQRN